MGKEEDVEEFSQIPGANGQSNAVYAAMLKSVDQSVGRVLEKLQELSLADHTIVVFTSDNGGAVHFGQPPATSNAPLRLGKGYAYEGGLRVPLVVKAPGVTRAGATVRLAGQQPGLFPHAAGAGRRQTRLRRRRRLTASVSCRCFGAPPTLPRRGLFWHYPHYWNGGKVSPYSVARVGDWKLIRFYETGREDSTISTTI